MNNEEQRPTMRTATEIARMLQVLISLRVKAEEWVFNFARTPEAYTAQRELFARIADTMKASEYTETFRQMPAAAWILAPEAGAGKIGSLRYYWFGEGAVPLAWLLGVLPELPPVEQSVNIVEDLQVVPLPFRECGPTAAQAFVREAHVRVDEGVALQSLRTLEALREALIPTGKKKLPTEVQKQLSRSVERARFLSWGLGLPIRKPRLA
ncbi:hypothetical protein LZC95_11750 [Pendulispora brunnea]|uniref:Uncharacterized protein n=1 Tax=Pendulispora brunnea TaxID=2905690 RepID=A0ABZ2KHG8_9BACT